VAKTYAVLFSHASTLVYEDYIGPQRFANVIDASTFGERIKNVQGVEYEVMKKIGDGEWLSPRGETALQVIRRRWA